MSLDQLNEELERRLIAGLQWEWHSTARYYLDSFNGISTSFRLPIFAIRQMTPCGTWNSQRYEIALSRDFILTHKWEAVVQVLRHEMVHQYVTVFLGEDERPHGPLFQQACHIFRISPKASISAAAISDDEAHSSQDRIVGKVHKLLALAQSSNKNEAETAMLKAQSLIQYYNLELLKNGEQRHYCSRWLGEVCLRHQRDEYALFRFITQFYFVRGITIRSFMVERNRAGTVFEISGTETNVELAHYVYDFIQNYITCCWEREHREKGKRHRVDFALGVIEGFKDKLEAGSCRNADATTALVRRGDPQLEDYMKYRYPRRTKRRRNQRQVNPEAHQAGYQKGQAMVIHKGVSSDSNRRSRMTGANGRLLS